jgi:hypothetical protein
MVGRVYLWQNHYWRVQVRWSGKGPRNVLLQRVYADRQSWSAWRWRDRDGHFWWPGTERVVRPFRGLRRVT